MGERCRKGGQLTAAAKWYERAAEQGHARGQNNLGLSFMFGNGKRKDLKAAHLWLKKSADQGLKYGQRNLGVLLLKIQGEEGIPEAISLFEKAASQGDARAKIELAAIFRCGPVGIKNDAHAASLYIDVIESAETQNDLIYAKSAKAKLWGLLRDSTLEVVSDSRVKTQFPDHTTLIVDPVVILRSQLSFSSQKPDDLPFG